MHLNWDNPLCSQIQIGKGKMAKNTNHAEYWLSANERETIDCPYQPGNLKISKNACLKRYQASEKAKLEMINHTDLFTYTVGQGLLRCKTCPIVKALPPHQSARAMSHGARL